MFLTKRHLGECISREGNYGVVYKLKGRNNLEIKLMRSSARFSNNENTNKEEFEIGKKLREDGISVPRYITTANILMGLTIKKGILMEILEEDERANTNEKINFIASELKRSMTLGYVPGDDARLLRHCILNKRTGNYALIDFGLWKYKEQVQ